MSCSCSHARGSAAVAAPRAAVHDHLRVFVAHSNSVSAENHPEFFVPERHRATICARGVVSSFGRASHSRYRLPAFRDRPDRLPAEALCTCPDTTRCARRRLCACSSRRSRRCSRTARPRCGPAAGGCRQGPHRHHAGAALLGHVAVRRGGSGPRQDARPDQVEPQADRGADLVDGAGTEAALG